MTEEELNRLQVSLFLLCMPVFAAPMEALAALGEYRSGTCFRFALRFIDTGTSIHTRRSAIVLRNKETPFGLGTNDAKN